MSTETLTAVPNDEVERIVASYHLIKWTCVVTPDGEGTSKIVASSPVSSAGSPPSQGAEGHMSKAKDLAARASAHADLAATNLKFG
jgi:hypothetical protein